MVITMWRVLIFFSAGMTALALPVSESEALANNTQVDNQILEQNPILDDLEQYMKTENISIKLPFTQYEMIMDKRSLDSNEIDFTLLNKDNEVQARKKSKVKKIFLPLLVLILLKAIVLIPLALGILGIKTWNAIQLSFISFVSSIVLAVWKLCSKINNDHPPTILHSAWDPHHLDKSDIAQQKPYSSYSPL